MLWSYAGLDDLKASPLLAAYLERREELVRYFRVRLRSEEAARDLVQDIYLKLTGPFPTDIGNPGAYLYRLGTNLMLDQIKQRGRTGRRETAWRELNTRAAGGEDVSEIPAADEALAARQQLAQIIAAVETVAPAAREAFRLHKLQGLSHQETATAMGISRSSVEKHIMTCLKVMSAKVAR